MTRLAYIALALGLMTTGLGQVQQAPQPPQQGQQQAPPAQPGATQEGQPAQTPAAKPARVVGQSQSQEEMNAWVAIEQATDMQQKAKLAEDFLTKYPESGLTPFAHQLLAISYQMQNDFEKFSLHAEKALEELPRNPLLLSSLAAAYAQKGQPDKALDRAQRALQALEGMPKPAPLGEGEWMLQRDQLAADSHYAIGVAHLTKYQQAPAPKGQPDANLAKAAEALTKAVELDPSHDRAYYHLGFVFGKQENGEKAIESYARAVALGGIAQNLAREQLQKLYQFVYRNTDGLEQAIVQQRAYVQKQIATKQAQAQSLQPQPTAPAQPAPATPPGQPNPSPQQP